MAQAAPIRVDTHTQSALLNYGAYRWRRFTRGREAIRVLSFVVAFNCRRKDIFVTRLPRRTHTPYAGAAERVAASVPETLSF